MKYRVKVTETYCDYFWVEAESKAVAEKKAAEFAGCELESVEATGETEGTE